MSCRRLALAAAAALAAVGMGLAACAVGTSADPVAPLADPVPQSTDPTATPGQTPDTASSSPATESSPLPTWPTGPEAFDPSGWDELTLCLNRTLLAPEGEPLADVRRMVLALIPERVARLQLDRTTPALTLVPAAGQHVTEDDVRTAFSALTNFEFDHDAALDAVTIAAPEGRPFTEQCAVYAEVTAMMREQNEQGRLPEGAPLITSLGLDLDDGLVSVGATEPEAVEFAELAAQTDLVDLYYFPISHG